MPEIQWLQRMEDGVKQAEKDEVANMAIVDYAALLEETEFK